VSPEGIRVLTPVLPNDLREDEVASLQRDLLDRYIAENAIDSFIAWYYTPMALSFSDHLLPEVTIYDCMDELSAFFAAPQGLIEQEQRLFERADAVFAGGASLYRAKKGQHSNVHLFPSSIDRNHFAAAREQQPDPDDQAAIPHPRIGFFGVLDERLDRELLGQVAADHPEWNFVLLGPIVKISPDEFPRANNIHYLGQKSYAELPRYLSNWDVAILPFARNAATRFISPTKTPEYLAAGKRVVSTPIHDVVTPYAELGLVRIGQDAREFGAAIEQCLNDADPAWIEGVDNFLAKTSWDKTFQGMWKEIQRLIPRNAARSGTYTAEERSGTNV
jgi:glycosyltransferase involved in cell wall biosynthesis